MKTMVGLFENMNQAQKAANDLQAIGIPRQEISILADNSDGRFDDYAGIGPAATGNTLSPIATDATAGAALGGATGVVMAVTGLALPGFGAIVAAGWLASTLAGAALGAALGGMVGALTRVGIPMEDAVYYTESIYRGDVLVAANVPEEQVSRVAALLDRQGAVKVEERNVAEVPMTVA